MAISSSLCVIVLLAVGGVLGSNISFHPRQAKVNVDAKIHVEAWVDGLEQNAFNRSRWRAEGEPADVVAASLRDVTCLSNSCNLSLEITGLFLGFGRVQLSRWNGTWDRVGSPLPVTVLREEKLIQKLFIAFVAVVVSLNNINMGCALDTGVVRDVLRKPVAPAIGFLCQFLVMPLTSYAAGWLLLEDPVLRLGLFTMGSSPAGGASNMWTVLLGGNLDLSITMTFVSTVAALATVPLWLFTLGQTILEGTHIVIPFLDILRSLASLLVPIGIGLLVQRHFPKVAARSKRLLAPVCIVLIVCIIVLASIANLYMFRMLTGRMVLAAAASVWAGFGAGAAVASLCKFPHRDVVAICVETGIQNSGIAFVLLSGSLAAPVSDMAAVVPVAASIITPIPLFLVYCCQRLRNCCCRSDRFELQSAEKGSIMGFDNPGRNVD